MQHSVSDGYRLLKQELSNLSLSSLKLLSSGTLAPSEVWSSSVLGLVPQSAQMSTQKTIEDNWEMVESATPPRTVTALPNPSSWSPPRWATPHSPSAPPRLASSTQPGSYNGDMVGSTWNPPQWAFQLRQVVKQAPSTPFGWKPPAWARFAHEEVDGLLNSFLFVKLKEQREETMKKDVKATEVDDETIWMPPRWRVKSGSRSLD